MQRNQGFMVGIFVGLLMLFAWRGDARGSTITEVENNDQFSIAQVVDPGITGVEGSLQRISLPTPDYEFTGSLDGSDTSGNPDEDYFDISGVSPNIDFLAWTDNSTSGVDTVLGWFDQAGNLLDVDDDSGPVGNGLASGLVGQADSDGEIHLGVTGYPNFFNGRSHDEEGAYTLYVALGVTGWADVDYYAFVDLPPGTRFVAETSPRNQSDLDTMLGWFDGLGNLLEYDDDGGFQFFSRLEGVVPSDGTVWLAVTGYPDWDFQGLHSESGDYLLTVTVQPVPEPATMVLFGTGLAGVWLHRRRRK